MKKIALLIGAGVLSATAFSQDITANATKSWEGTLGTKANTGAGAGELVDIYSNVTTFTGQGFINGSATAGSQITKLVADDINFDMSLGVTTFDQFTFSVVNFDAAAFSARPRVRFFEDNAGVPGNYITGFSFNPITFNAGSVSTFFANSGVINVPVSGKMWAGITFDNVGATATVAQLNNLGQGIWTPPTAGTSADLAFATTASGSFNVNNPVGSTFNFGVAGPVANFGWKFTNTTAVVPEPASMAALGLGILGLAKRRKKS